MVVVNCVSLDFTLVMNLDIKTLWSKWFSQPQFSYFITYKVYMGFHSFMRPLIRWVFLDTSYNKSLFSTFCAIAIIEFRNIYFIYHLQFSMHRLRYITLINWDAWDDFLHGSYMHDLHFNQKGSCRLEKVVIQDSHALWYSL